MATVMTPNNVNFTGLTQSLVAAVAGGYDVPTGPNIFLIINNASGASITATLSVLAKYRGLTIADNAITVGAGATKIVGPILPELFADTDGYANLALSATASVTLACFVLASY